jgi:hypothetical protein
MLTQKAFEESRRFIETSARPLEIARFRHAFDGESGDVVIEALEKFRNADGGFGHALEPDLRVGESSALCTTIAFQILRATRLKNDPVFVPGSITYLLETLDRKQGHWRIIPKAAEHSPHAPWWNQTGRDGEFDRFSLNPTAEILGVLHDHREQVPHELLSELTDRVIRHLSGLEKIEMHDLLCCLRLHQTKNLPEEIGGHIHRELTRLIDDAVTWDPTQWKGYTLRPLQVIDDPDSPFIAGRQASVSANIEYEISSRNADGSWTPTWSWGDSFPSGWALARRE